TTFFTLGFGDLTAATTSGRVIAVVESGVGFGFLALVISYLPVLYQSFSKREAPILLLDARAGTPPVAGDLLIRSAEDMESLTHLLAEYERWCAQLLESYLSYPVLAYYRSQHDRITWFGTLAVLMDACALIRLDFRNNEPWERALRRQAEHTYAIARHVLVDLAFILGAPPTQPVADRMPQERFGDFLKNLDGMGVRLHFAGDAERKFGRMRREYEPYLAGLAEHLLYPLPPLSREHQELDSWQTSAWDKIAHF
ncbi:MAG TPA: potassium channel family protein, partial [Fimbriimonadaceae bacterium]|nr:potassium channel family protein [Fimbriimonadaceae bacterium]